jgi:uroporphyrinogen-III synthase
LRKNRIRPDYVSESNGSEKFAFELKQDIISKGANVLLLLGNLAEDTLQNALSDHTNVSRIDCYQTNKPDLLNNSLLKKIADNEYDLLLFTSSSCFKNFISYFKDAGPEMPKLKTASIGPSTTKTMRKFGIQPLFTAKQSNLEGIVKGIKSYYKPKRARIKPVQKSKLNFKNKYKK